MLACPGMTAAQRAKFRNLLEQVRKQLVETGPARIEPNRRDPATTGVADEDAQALSEMLQVLASQRNKGQADLLARVGAALRKLASAPEDYGLCEQCEEEIPPRRLALMPYATLCAACQAKAEPRTSATRRGLSDRR
jgi:DnaK suppressor protein